MNGSCSAPASSPFVGVGGAEQRVDELPRARRDSAEGGEDEGDEGSPLVNAPGAMMSVLLLLAGEEQDLVIFGGGVAPRGEERVGDRDVDGD